MEPMGTTATSSQVHEASVCVSFCFCRCLCMHKCMWFTVTILFCFYCTSVYIFSGVMCCVFYFMCACMCACVCSAYSPSSSYLACLSISYSAAQTKCFSNHRISACRNVSPFLSSTVGVQEPSRHRLFPLAVKPHSFHQRLPD